MSAQETSVSLYERRGGVYSIAVVVDDFVDRVMADARLNANPAVDEAHHKVPPAGFKYLVTEMGLLGQWRAAEVYRPLHGRLPSPSQHHPERMGRVHG